VVIKKKSWPARAGSFFVLNQSSHLIIRIVTFDFFRALARICKEQ